MESFGLERFVREGSEAGGGLSQDVDETLDDGGVEWPGAVEGGEYLFCLNVDIDHQGRNGIGAEDADDIAFFVELHVYSLVVRINYSVS